jgi:hypothetical protein
MESALVSGIQGLFLGVLNLGPGHVIMILVGSLLLYLGIAKGYEPLLLVPIGFGAILARRKQLDDCLRGVLFVQRDGRGGPKPLLCPRRGRWGGQTGIVCGD